MTESSGPVHLRVLRNQRAPALVGRGESLHVLEGVLDDARRGDGRAVVVRGEAGIGKTAMLAGLAADAEGMLVLQARGLESEAQLAYSGLFDLCRPLLGRFERLPEFHQAALRSALALAAPSGQDHLAAAVALLALITLLAQDTPVLVVVDDGQWLDAASAETLSFVARRLSGAPVACVIAVRGEGPGDSRYEGLDELFLGGLREDDAAHLLAQHALDRVAEPVARTVARISEGNPLALIELAELLSADQLAGRTPLPSALPVGPRLTSVFDRHLAGLPDDAARSAGIAALWEGGLSALADAPTLDFDVANLAPAAAAGLLTITGDTVVFRHPLARSAAIRSLSGAELRGVHRAMAGLLEDDLELRAWHLAAGAHGPDDVAAAALASAAESAAARGALATAADMLERAAELTLDGNLRGARLVDAAGLAGQSGATKRAVRLCDRARMLVTDPTTRGRLEHQRGRLALFGAMAIPEAISLLGNEFRRVADLDPDLAVRIGVEGCMLAVVAGNQALAVDLAGRVREIAQRASADTQSLAGFALQAARAFANETIDIEALDLGYARLIAEYPIFLDLKTVTAMAMVGLTALEMYGPVRALGERFTALARARGAIGALPLVLALAAKAALFMDDWVSAERDAQEALHLADEAGQSFGAHYATAWLAMLSALRGHDDRVETRAAEVLGWNGVIGTSPGHAIISHALGVLALGHGRNAEAVVHLNAVARLRTAQNASSDGMLHWEGDHAEALIRTGRRDEAEAQLMRLEKRARDAGSSWSAVVASRCRGLLADDADIDSVFARAFGEVLHLQMPFEWLRNEWCWGERLIAAGRRHDAAAHLRAAMVGFEGFGATSWAARARAALERAGCEPIDSPPATRVDLDPAPGVAPSAAAPATSAGAAAPSTDARLIVTLGDFLVRSGGQESRLIGHVGRAIAFVAARGAAVHVDELIDALWPDATVDVGRRRLRNVLSRTRQTTDSILVRDGDVVRLADDVAVDLAIFETLAADAVRRAAAGDATAADSARAALAYHRGEFIPSSRYDDWIVAVREGVERRRLALLELLAADAERRGEADGMLAYLELAIQADPDDEERYLHGARALAALGRHGPALRLLERAEVMLVGIHARPSHELAALREQLVQPG